MATCTDSLGISLLQRYPTALTNGDAAPERARSWDFSAADIFRLSKFKLRVGKDLDVVTGPADLGVGHCGDGVVWAIVLPRGEGLLRMTNRAEAIKHVWLRFHPGELDRLFPPETVFSDGAKELAPEMRFIAGSKMRSSWQAGGKALIPEPKDLTVDLDSKEGLRRFFVVDRANGTARYISAFEEKFVKNPPAITTQLAEAAFDELWQEFDRHYAMFVIRPEVDWLKLREEFRPKAIQSKSTHEFAEVVAEMLKHLRDLHVWLTVAGVNVPVFDRPRPQNGNRAAIRTISDDLKTAGPAVEWSVTSDHVGYIAIHGWNSLAIPDGVDKVLEEMRATRALITDVRFNGGGGEPSAQRVAGRFLDKEFTYAISQIRNGPQHTELSEKRARKVRPTGPWRYDRPVIVLIGPRCMSSNESFIKMMTGSTNVTTMGERTCGSSGNPKILQLPLDMTVSVPRWIDYLPDGTPLDERGVEPQVRFVAKEGAFEGVRDDLLSAAFDRLRAVPLPDGPIASPQ